MEKLKPFGKNLSEQLKASRRDKLYQFLLQKKTIRGATLHATRLVNEMRSNHNCGPLETLILGQAYIAAGLMSVNLKPPDRLRIKINCDGPLQGLIAETNAFGEVRGYLLSNPIIISMNNKTPTISKLFGKGTIEITKFTGSEERQFNSIIEIRHGSIAKDLTNYFNSSEQIPNAFNLDVSFDKRGNIIGAGGIFLQAMPDAELDRISDLEIIIKNLSSIGLILHTTKSVESFIKKSFADHNPEIISSRRMAFMCHCNSDSFQKHLGALPMKDLTDIFHNGPYPVITTCKHCNTSYEYNRDIFKQLISQKESKQNDAT